MTAPTARDIETAALAALAQFPTVARFVQAGDPRVLAQIRAQVTMLAMLAEQVDMAQFEGFTKSRDSTVLADATLKGILPLARSCRAALNVTNGDAAPFALAAGRRLQDPKGRIFMVDSDIVIQPGATISVAVTQKTTRAVAHQVAVATPFYRMEVTASDKDTYLTTLAVFLAGEEFTYAPDWFNVQPGDLAYQVETDELRRLLVCMGKTDVIGYGVAPGDNFELRVTECEGRISDLTVDAPFALEYAYTPADGKLVLKLGEVTDIGAAPPTTADLRVMARYPAIYDHNAVYLGNFDELLRRYMTGIEFLSVWNEQVEEDFRGPSVDQINRLFVSIRVTGMTQAVMEARVRELIARADDSYKVVFVEPLDYPVSVAVEGKIAVVHDPATVEAQIRGALLGTYGQGQPAVSVGMENPLRVQVISDQLKQAVPAFQDDKSDFTVTISMLGTPLPEQFLFIADDTLDVLLEHAEHTGGLWNH